MPISWPAAFALPGLAPDALLFAARTAIAVLLAYTVAFAAQVQAASSAGRSLALAPRVGSVAQAVSPASS